MVLEVSRTVGKQKTPLQSVNCDFTVLHREAEMCRIKAGAMRGENNLADGRLVDRAKQ